MGTIVSTIKRKWNKATMSPGQERLYNIMSRTAAPNPEKGEVTFTVPADAKPADVQKVRRQFELENAGTVTLVNAPIPKGIDMPFIRAELKNIFAQTVEQLHAIADASLAQSRGDMEQIYGAAGGAAGRISYPGSKQPS